MPSPKIQTEYFAMQGGLNLVSPALTIPPGMVIDCNNFEPSIYGGYSRMKGFERFDGRASPSSANYYIAIGSIDAPIVAGNTITGVTSGATAVVLSVIDDSTMIVTRLTGVFVAESFTVGGLASGTLDTVSINAAGSPYDHAVYRSLAANSYRTLITKVPGAGPVRGVKYYNGSLYAFRNNVAGTACVMYKASPAGWVAVAFGREIQFAQRSSVATITIAAPGVVTWTAHKLANGQQVTFSTTGNLPTGLSPGFAYYVVGVTANTFELATTIGGTSVTTSGTQSGIHTAYLVATEINEGDIVTGVTSGALAVAKRVLLRTGTWNTAPIGSIVFDTVTGVFVSGEPLSVAGKTIVNASTADTAIGLAPGGRFVFDNNNFSGTSATYRMYGCDGVNLLFEFDGTRLIPIRTGAIPDAPSFLAIWKNMMVVSVGASIQLSSIGDPYAWTALTGAAELAIGDVCTGLLPQLGNQQVGALAVFSQHKTFILYGTSTADLQMIEQSPDAGAQAYSSQNIGYAYYLDTKGVVQINSSQAFGNFQSSTLTRLVQPFIDIKRGLCKASCIVRSKNQYRLFFSDGTGLIIYITETPQTDGVGSGVAQAIMPFTYSLSGMFINGVDSVVDTSGIERLFAAGSDGFVYELDQGTSFDGGNIPAHLIMSFNNSKTPRSRKHYKRVILQADCDGIAQVNVGYDLSYSGSESASGVSTLSTLVGTGGYWDQAVWDSFNWDSPVVQEYVIDTPGNGRNIGLLIYSDNAIDESYTISSAIINYIINRLER